MHVNKRMSDRRVAQAYAFALCFAFVNLSGLRSAHGQFRSDTSHVSAATDSMMHQDSMLHYADLAFRPNNYLQRAIVVGLSIGYPGGMNLALGGYYDHAGLILVGGALPMVVVNILGYQAEFCYVLLRGDESLVQCAVAYSHTESSGADGPPGWDITDRLGLNVAVNAGGFFVEYGIAHSFGNPGLVNSQVGQIGYCTELGRVLMQENSPYGHSRFRPQNYEVQTAGQRSKLDRLRLQRDTRRRRILPAENIRNRNCCVFG